MKSLIRAIQTQYWAIEPSYAVGYHATLNQIFNHEHIEQLKEKDLNGAAQFLGVSGFLFDDEIEGDVPEGDINVVQIKGAILKYDTMCETGTSTMAKIIEEGENNESIAFHLLVIDSGGGQVAGTAHFGNVIKSAKKPVIAFVDGMAASAAYWIASQADHIIINDKTSMVGSIGTMVSFYDITQMLESKGVKSIEIYADKSKDKNKDFREALKGNEEPMKETLNALNNEFLDAVKSGRPNLNQKSTLTGKMFIGEDVINEGLADSIGSINTAVSLGYQLSKNEYKMNTTEKEKFFSDFKKLLGIQSNESKNEANNAKEEKMAIEQLEAQILELNQVIEGKNTERLALEAQLNSEKEAIKALEKENIEAKGLLETYSTKLEEATSIIASYKAREESAADEEVLQQVPVSASVKPKAKPMVSLM